MLNSAAGANLVDFLAQSKGKILLPEIVEKELRHGVSKQARSAADKIAVDIDRLHKLTRQEIAFNSPSSAVIEAGIETNLKGLEQLLIRCHFTFEHAKDALNRIYLGRPPCGQNNELTFPSKWWTPLISSFGSRKVFDGYSASSIHG